MENCWQRPFNSVLQIEIVARRPKTAHTTNFNAIGNEQKNLKTTHRPQTADVTDVRSSVYVEFVYIYAIIFFPRVVSLFM